MVCWVQRTALSLATVRLDVPLGAEVQVIWGEPDGGTDKTTVEPHEQFAVRAIVSSAPYWVMARESYRPGWRTAVVSSWGSGRTTPRVRADVLDSSERRAVTAAATARIHGSGKISVI